MDPNVAAGYYQPQCPPGQQQQTTTIVVQQPQATIIPQNSREWTHGLCACCEDLGECTRVYNVAVVLCYIASLTIPLIRGQRHL